MPCSSYCGCDHIPPELVEKLIVYDYDVWNYQHNERLPPVYRNITPPQGITFKLPRPPGACVSNAGHNCVQPLFDMSFKIAAILCENFVRRTFCVDPDFEVLNFHYRQFILAYTCLVRHFHWPPTLALWLLPRLPISPRRVGVYPPGIRHNTCSYRFWFRFKEYLRLRC